MKRTKIIRKATGILLFSSMMLSSCSDLDEYFETPGWISGSVYEELSGQGSYSIFLKGVDRAGYTTIMNGKSILTVMAPTDDAMREYLQANYSTTDIEQVPVEEVKKLIGFHILYYSFDKQKLTNFRPLEGDGATEEQLDVNGGLYYKFRTHSQDAISRETITDHRTQREDGTYNTRDLSIYHFERLLPVFSYKMFQTKNINAKKNYEYFYPNTGWRDDAGFNIANAGVTEYADIAKNGYIYKIDRVLKPLETIYKELKKNGKYNKFLALYDNYEYPELDEAKSIELNTGSDSLYHRYHQAPLANIDCEWPVTDYQQVANMALRSYSVFAPTDQALDNFFNDYWKIGGYESLDEVDDVSIQDLLFNCVYSQSIAFPEEIENGTILNSSNEVISFNTDEVQQEDRIICTNGVLYGCSVLTPPSKFHSVTGPAYQYKKFSNFLTMVDRSGLTKDLTSNAVNFIMLYPDNNQLKNYGGIIRSNGSLVNAGDLSNVNTSTMQNYVYAHLVQAPDGNTVLPQTGIKVYKTLSPNLKLYWYVKDGKLTNSIKHNELLRYAANNTSESDVFATVEALDYRGDVNGWTNGHTYSYKDMLFEGSFNNIAQPNLTALMLSNNSDRTTEFYGFVQLLDKAGAINWAGQELVFRNEHCLTFIPVTNAVEQAIIDGKIPGISVSGANVGDANFFEQCTVTDKAALLYYVQQYFIPESTAVVSNDPYVGWGENTELSGGLITLQQDQNEGADGQISIVTTNMNIYDDGTKLSVGIINRTTGTVNKRVNVTSTYDYLPFIFNDLSAHFIEDVLE